MDNKAAIKELAYLYDKIKDIRSKVAIDAGIKALEQESKTGRWIPVAERLPEGVNDVLCWYIYSKNDKLYQTYGIGFYWNEIWGGEKWYGERCKVIAWMPLPEPYKAESEEK